MPENNLGTAEGRIRIKYDTRGTDKAASSLIKLHKQFEVMNKRLLNIEKSMRNSELATDKTSKSFERASRSSKNLDKSLFKTHKSIKSFSTDATQLARDMGTLTRVVDQAATKFNRFAKVATVLADVGKYNGNLLTAAHSMARVVTQTNLAARAAGNYTDKLGLLAGKLRLVGDGANSLYRLRTASILATAGFTGLYKQVIGTNRAMREMPMWTQKLFSLATSIGKVGAAGLVFSRLVQAGGITKGLNAIANNGWVRKALLNNERFAVGFENTARRVERSAEKLSHFFQNGFRPFVDFAKHSKSLLTGAALVTSGIRGIVRQFQWLGRIPRPILMALGVSISTILPAALEVLGKAFTGTSNLLLGLLDGVKQLSGALLVLPGAFAAGGAAALTMGAIFGGLGKKFSALFTNDAEKRWEAMADIPEHLRPVATALVGVYKEFGALQGVLQKDFFAKAAGQIDQLSGTYFPLLIDSMSRTSNAMRGMVDRFVDFLNLDQTKQDTGTIFTNTAQGLRNMEAAIIPALAGLRDIAVVGTEFIRDMSAGLPGLAQGFAQWADANRRSGQLMRWMQESRKGIYDLVTGMVDLTKAAWTLLTVFGTTPNTNFLENFANWAEKLNGSIERSAATGWLRDFAEGIRGLGTDKLRQLGDIFGYLKDTLSEVVPFIANVSNTFSAIFIPAIKQALVEIRVFTSVLNDLGIDKMIGLVLGFTAAWKLLPTVIVPVYHALKTVAGGFLVLQNAGKVTAAIETAMLGLGARMEKVGGVTAKVGTGMVNTTAGMSKLLGTVGAIVGPLSVMAITIGLVSMAIVEGNNRIEQFDATLKTSKDNVNKYGQELRKAFMADNGLKGANVMTATSESVKQLQTDLDAVVANAPSWQSKMADTWNNIGDSFKNWRSYIAPWTKGNSQVIEQQEKQAKSAELAATGIEKMINSGEDLTALITGSQAAFEKRTEELNHQGQEGQATAKKLGELRAQYELIEKSTAELGPATIELQNGLKKIAEAGGDATSKLEGLTSVLRGLGFLKTDALQAAADYADAIDNLAQKVQDAIAPGETFADAWDKVNGTLNVNSRTGANLLDVFASLGQQFRSMAVNGGNVDEMYGRLSAQFDEVANKMGISREELERFIQTSVGIVPNTIKIALQLENADPLTQQIGQILLQIDAKVPVKLGAPTVEEADKLDDEIERIIGRDITDQQGLNVVLKAGVELSQADIAKLQQELGAKGIELPGAPPASAPPAKIPTAPVLPGTDPNAPGAPGTVPQPGNLDEAWGQITGSANAIIDDANESGKKFVDSYAAGLKDNPAAKNAADRMAEEVLKSFHQSPPKRGPLAAHGDAAKYAGKQFGASYGTGMGASEAGVASAADSVAGAASGSLSGDKAYEAGKFLGRLSSLVDFAQNFTEAMGDLTQNILGFAKFFSDPMGKGTFFGQRPKWIRDPNISDDQLAQQKADAAQQRVFGFAGSGQRPDLYDPKTGRIKGTDPGKLAGNAGKQDIANYIIQKAMAQGYSREQANQFLIQAVGESGLDPASNGGNQNGTGDVRGIFQFTPDTWGNRSGKVTNPQDNIDAYFDLAAERGLTPETFKSGVQLGEQVSIGGPWHPENQAKGHLTQAQAAAQEYIKNFQEGVGQTVDGIAAGVPAAVANATGSKLRPGEGVEAGLEPAAAQVAAMLSNMFPGITDIGGRQERSGPQMHPDGRALDVMTGQDAELGDRIAAFLEANYAALGVQSYIWRDVGKNLVANEGGGPGTTYGSSGHGGPSGTEDGSHVHIQFADGGKLDVNPDGTMNMQIPANSPMADLDYGLPLTPEERKNAKPPSRDRVVRNPDGTFTPVQRGDGARPGPDEPINPMTGKPYTPEEEAEFWNRPENALQYDPSQLNPGDLDAPGIYKGTQEEMLEELKAQTPLLSESLAVLENQGSSDTEVANALGVLEGEQARQEALGTAQGRAMASEIGGKISSAASDRGLTQEQNPIDKAAGIAATASSIAGDIFAVINSAIEAVGATKNIADTLVRGPSNTEDIFRMIDDFQKYIQLAADVAGAVSSVAGAIGSVIPSEGTFGAGAAVSAIGQIAGLVQSALETVNAMIDLGQEAYRIIGSYVGDFLGILTGGAAGALEGNVKFLLDETTNELLAYSADNPLDKRSHNLAFQERNPDARNQMIGELNYYAGPGTDPRDQTRQMMLQIRTSQMTTATGQ